MDINASEMLPSGAAVVGSMVWTTDLSSMPRDKNLGLALRILVNVQLLVSASNGIRVEY